MRTARRGGVFLLALVVVTAITTILAILASRQQLAVRQTLNRLETERARRMAEAGAQRAIAEIALITETNVTTTLRAWFTLGNNGDDRFLCGSDSFRLHIIDGASLVNLNTATQTQLESLGLTTEQIDSLLDWREAGNTPRAEGAKDEYYNSLETPYNARKARMEVFTELLSIKGFTPDALYEPLQQSGTQTFSVGDGTLTLAQTATVDSFSPNQNPDSQTRGNINTAQVGQLIQAGLTPLVAQAVIARRGGGYTGMGQVLQTPGLDNRQAGILVDRFGVGGAARVEGRLNVNTATESTLQTLTGLTSDIASGIVSRQSAGINALSELLQVPGLTVAVLQQTVDSLAVSSDVFLVRVQGEAGSTTVAREFVVRLQEGRPRVIKTLETPRTNMVQLWNWNEETVNEVDLGVAE